MEMSQPSLTDIGRFDQVARERGLDESIYKNITADQICIGQALALGCGMMVRFQAGVRGYSSNSDILFNTMEELVQMVTTSPPMEEGSIICYAVSYHHHHATRVFAMRKGGMTHIWYYNPWGSRMDHEYAWRLHNTNLQSTPGCPDQETTLRILENPSDRSCKEGVIEDWETRSVAVFPVQRSDMFPLPSTHVMSFLEWKRNQSNRSDIIIIHPSMSMPVVGPQIRHKLAGCKRGNFFIDAVKGCLHKKCSTADKWIVGACCVWEEVYSAHVRVDIELGHDPVSVISNLRDRCMLTQELSPKDLIGKFMYVLMPRDAGHGCAEALSNLEFLMGSLPSRGQILDYPNYSIDVVESYQKAVHTLDVMKIDGYLNGDDFYNREVIRDKIDHFLRVVTTGRTTIEHRLQVEERSANHRLRTIPMGEHVLVYFLKFLLLVAACKQERD